MEGGGGGETGRETHASVIQEAFNHGREGRLIGGRFSRAVESTLSECAGTRGGAALLAAWRRQHTRDLRAGGERYSAVLARVLGTAYASTSRLYVHL